jgi:hypothetical protein
LIYKQRHISTSVASAGGVQDKTVDEDVVSQLLTVGVSRAAVVIVAGLLAADKSPLSPIALL